MCLSSRVGGDMQWQQIENKGDEAVQSELWVNYRINKPGYRQSY